MKPNPYIVATGTTSAFLSDERLLREFIVGDHWAKSQIQQGNNAVLYLINDSYDALTERQLRIAVNKDERLMKLFAPFCGQPIAEIPDPFETHSSLSEHFINAQLDRLHKLGIHPVVVDAYRAYQGGHYKKYTDITFANYQNIQEMLAKENDAYSMKNLFRAQCSHCKSIDSTHITKVSGNSISIECDRCGNSEVQSPDTIKGKLSWKLDCAARWNMYGIDAEAFSKSHITDLGSYDASCLISEHYFGGVIPRPVKYGEVKLSRELSYRLLDILPPEMFKRLYLDNPERDLDLTKSAIEHFSRRFEVKPGMSFVDFIKNELPVLAIQSQNAFDCEGAQAYQIGLDELVAYGNRFSAYYAEREYKVCLSGTRAVSNISQEKASLAMDILAYALSVRKSTMLSDSEKLTRIMAYLKNFNQVRGLFPYIRKTFAQHQGPGLATLLNTLPVDFINVVRMAMGFYVAQDLSDSYTKQSVPGTNSEQLMNESEDSFITLPV